MAQDQSLNKNALKVHHEQEPYEREVAVYERLCEAKVSKILDFNVPQLLAFDHNLRVIEMTIVTRPFVLDFAGAWLDFSPKFSDEIWAEWEDQKRDQFGPKWPKVQQVLAALEALDIHMIDVSPSNIAFADQ